MFAVRLLNICAHVIDEATPGPPPTKPTLPSLPNPPSLSPIRRRGRTGITGKDKDDRSSPQGTPAKEKDKGSSRTPSKGLYSLSLSVSLSWTELTDHRPDRAKKCLAIVSFGMAICLIKMCFLIELEYMKVWNIISAQPIDILGRIGLLHLTPQATATDQQGC